jgi:glutaredoxin
MTTRLKLKSAKKKSKYKRRKSFRKKSVRKRSVKKKSLSIKKKQTSKNDGRSTSSKTKKYDIIILEKCPFCKDLVDILQKNNVKYNYIEIERNDEEQEKKTICKKIITDKFSKEHNTFPMIFHNGKFLGGLDKFKKILNV